MSLLGLILIIGLVLLLTGGDYYGHSAGWFSGSPAFYGGGLLGTVLIIVLVIYLLRGGL